MGEAFDAACTALHNTGEPEIVYEVIAKRIIDAAKNGERKGVSYPRRSSPDRPPEASPAPATDVAAIVRMHEACLSRSANKSIRVP